MAAQWRKPQVIIFSRKCCPNAPRRRQAVCCVNYSPTATPSLGRSSGHHHRRGTPHGERHDPNGVGSTARSASARRRTWARRACCYFGVSTSNRFLISAVGRSIPDLSAGNRKVRSTPVNGHRQAAPACLKSVDIVAKVENRTTLKISRKLTLDFSAVASLFNAPTQVRDQFWMKQYGPTRRRA